MLAPHQPLVDQGGYKIKYNADSNALACPITAEARDGSNTITGHTATSDVDSMLDHQPRNSLERGLSC